jgi:hypothetical protein
MSEDNRDARALADQLIAGLAKTVGIPEMSLGERGRCDLSFDDQRVAIVYEATTEHMCLEAPVMEIPSSPADEFYPWMLEANFASFVAGAGCLALDLQAGQIYWLNRRPVKGLERADFDNWLTSGIETAELWARALRERVNSASVAKPLPQETWSDAEVVFRL